MFQLPFKATMPGTRGRLRTVLAAAALVAVAAAPLAAQQDLRTGSEQAGFERHTTHPEMMEYLTAMRASSPDMRLGSYGETREGRELAYAIFSRPLISQPWEAAVLDRPVVVLAANVHGGERTLREGLLILMRELATRGTEANALLDDMVVVVAPQINPDGFHASERGQRGNAWGIDLNRDYVKLEHPEIAGYVGNLINNWHPHLFVDGHNGGSYPYNVNYQCPSHASPAAAITALCDFELFPYIDRVMEGAGYKTWYYTGGNETQWRTGGDQARIGRNYGGFVNTIGVLFESPGGQDPETGALSGRLAYLATLQYVRDNAAEVMETVKQARLETLRMGLQAEGQVVVDMEYGPEDRTVTYEIRDPEDRDRLITITSDSLMKKPIPTQTRTRPYAYILPRDAVDAVAMLRRHGITVEQLVEEATVPVQAYTVADVDYTRQYNHAAAVMVEVGQVVDREMELPPGTFVVPTGQMLGRLVAHMLEPETDDNVLYWNTMDAWLPRPTTGQGGGPGGQGSEALVPIYKLLAPRALPTKIVP
ncbi:MAG: M14 family zinc carboxypeptidase [Gemmatimonadota bacterium]